MQAFFTTLFSFPAVIPSILLGAVLLYWLLLILGALDLELFGDVDFGDFFHSAGIIGMPSGILLSIVIFFFWLICVPLTHFLVLAAPLFYWQIGSGIVVLGLSFWLSLYPSLWLISPMQRFFQNHEKFTHRRDLLGQTCRITTSRVDEDFGQAEYDDGGAGLLIDVRADMPNPLRRHDTALILEYKPDNQTYIVAAFSADKL